MTCVAAAAFIGSRVAGHDDIVAGYWAIGFTFGVEVHDRLSPRRRPS